MHSFLCFNLRSPCPVLKYRDPLYWINLKENRSKTTYNNHKNKLKEINKTLGGNIHSKIRELIIKKIEELDNDVFTFSYFNYIGKTLSYDIDNTNRIIVLHYGMVG